jgi:hypothetical protein
MTLRLGCLNSTILATIIVISHNVVVTASALVEPTDAARLIAIVDATRWISVDCHCDPQI